MQRNVANVRREHGEAVRDRGVQYRRIVLDFPAYEMTCKLHRETDDLILDGPLEPLERMRERGDERLEPRGFGLAGSESFCVTALPRLFPHLPLERFELAGREQVRAALRGAAQRVGGRLIDGRKIPTTRRCVVLTDDSRAHQTNSSLPPASMIVPSSERRSTTARISFCACSTSLKRTGPFDAMSSRRISAARFDMFLKIFSRISSSAPFKATARRVGLDFAQDRLHAAVVDVEQVVEHEQRVLDQLAELRVFGLDRLDHRPLGGTQAG